MWLPRVALKQFEKHSKAKFQRPGPSRSSFREYLRVSAKVLSVLSSPVGSYDSDLQVRIYKYESEYVL